MRAIYAIVCLMKMWVSVSSSGEVSSIIKKEDLQIEMYLERLVTMFTRSSLEMLSPRMESSTSWPSDYKSDLHRSKKAHPESMQTLAKILRDLRTMQPGRRLNRRRQTRRPYTCYLKSPWAAAIPLLHKCSPTPTADRNSKRRQRFRHTRTPRNNPCNRAGIQALPHSRIPQT